MNEHQNPAGEVPLSKFAADLCPVLWQMRWKARLLAKGRAPLPPGATARLAKCAAKLAVKETARLVTKESGAINSCPVGAEEFTGEEGAIPPDANVYLDADNSSGAGAKVMIWYGDSPARISPEHFARIESLARERAQAEAERLVRDFYKRIADRAEQRICENVLRDLREGSRYRFIGRRGDALSEPIPARLVERYLVKPWAESITLLPADSDDQEQVWRDVFTSRLPNMPSTPTPKDWDGAKAAPLPPELVDWYRARAEIHDPATLPPTREDDERDAAAAFPGMKHMRKLVRRVRAQEAPPKWKEDGPKGRKKLAHEDGAAKNLGHAQVAKLP